MLTERRDEALTDCVRSPVLQALLLGEAELQLLLLALPLALPLRLALPELLGLPEEEGEALPEGAPALEPLELPEAEGFLLAAEEADLEMQEEAQALREAERQELPLLLQLLLLLPLALALPEELLQELEEADTLAGEPVPARAEPERL